MSTEPERTAVTRMPHGVMDYLQRGATPVEIAEAEVRAAAGDPETYERAVARQQERLRQPPVVRNTGTPTVTRLLELLAPDEEG